MIFCALAEQIEIGRDDRGMTLDYGDTIGGRVHWLRKNRHLRIGEIADQLGVRSSHLSGIENNKGMKHFNSLPKRGPANVPVFLLLKLVHF